MKISIKSFNTHIEKNFLFEKNPKIAVAVSGGPDSMCLLFLLSHWIKKKRGKLIALIVDHKIRTDSLTEAKIVKNYLTKNKINSEILTIRKKRISKKNMKEARDNRFEILNNYCKKNRILHLFLGHHYDDNIETFLIRQLSGSNFEGLSAMKFKFFKEKIQILRPLLNYTKKEILRFNKNNEIYFINDPSNKNLKYSRVVVRNFLSKNYHHKINIVNDFKCIVDNSSSYKQMIFQALNKLIVRFNNKEIMLDTKKFALYDIEIQSKIIDIIYKYFKSNRGFLRYKKIVILLENLFLKECFKSNLGGMIIKKDKFFINFAL